MTAQSNTTAGKSTAGSKKTKKSSSTAKRPRQARPRNLLFALDIGTRSVIGIVAEQKDQQLKIIATHRQEHATRSMLDGQIHDVPQVAAVLASVKKELEKTTGPLKHVAVAAAGRALYTMTAEVEQELPGIITITQERELEFAGVQAAQHKLAVSNTVDDPTLYYCVGYSTVSYTLDGTPIKTLVGQRGKIAAVTVIATFLPRQVIDSMQSALHTAKLDMRALTLEPIAAINVLIPSTMRHLNLVLVDIGAGTSDIAITRNGSVIAYGMVPLAGDEITEAISQKYLLDFKVAEHVKRDVANRISEKISFQDILGITSELLPEEIVASILPSIANLAETIAKQILSLNGAAPQAVLLVGGGSLTPRLPELVAQELSLPAGRVAVRRPEVVDGIDDIPADLQTPDAVTPLGILKIASLNTLHFLSVQVNGQEYSLFNFRDLTIADALLAAGINLKKLNGRPGLGIMLSVNGEKKFIRGTMGTASRLALDGEPAEIDDAIKNGCKITLEPGSDGATPHVSLQDFVTAPPPLSIYINGEHFVAEPVVLINGQPAEPGQELRDNDEITCRELKNSGEILRQAGYEPAGRKFKYQLNGQPAQHTVTPEIRRNGQIITLSTPLENNDEIDFIYPKPPQLGELLNLSDAETSLTVSFNKKQCRLPAAGCELSVNGQPATVSTPVQDGSDIRCLRSERKTAIVSDVLLAANFQPPSALSKVTFQILVNGRPAEFTSPVKNGDAIDIVLTPLDETSSTL